MDNFEEVRAAFIAMIKAENAEVDRWQRQSLKQNWAGRRHGFHDPNVNKRWYDFYKGYMAGFPKGYEAGCHFSNQEKK